jgi:hypothetical protein
MLDDAGALTSRVVCTALFGPAFAPLVVGAVVTGVAAEAPLSRAAAGAAAIAR